MRIQIALASVFLLAAGALAPGCGCNRDGQLPPPPKGAKAAPWAKDGTAGDASGRASFRVRFEDVNGAIQAASEIYMNVKDPYGRSAFNTTTKAEKDGSALFEGVPVGNYMLEFIDKSGRRSRLRVDLGNFTGANAGKDAGVANF
jgi:hypothetical protein